MAYSFDTIIASRGYHVYKETSWSNAKVGDDVKVEIETNPKSVASDPYSCAIKTKHDYFVGWKTVGTFLVKFQDTFTFLSNKKVERLTKN